jgi:hypothetical protein
MIALPLALAVVKPSSDYVLPRYLIAALVPCLIIVAAGLAAGPARRLGLVAGVALPGIFLSMTISIAARDELQRPDWRTLARAIGAAPAGRVVITNMNVQARPLMMYMPQLRPVYDAGSVIWAGDPPEKGRTPLTVREIDYVTPYVFSARAGRAAPSPGFRLTARRAVKGFVVLTYRSRAPAETTAGELARSSSGVYGFAPSGPLAASVYLQRPGG